MKVRGWRIVTARHKGTAFSGDGARLYGGRWNSPGRAAVYVAGSASLAVLEMLAHLPVEEFPRAYVLIEAEFDEGLVARVEAGGLPAGWRESPPPPEVQHVGDDWLAEARSAVLQVPSAIVPVEWNFLLNPAHPDFARIKIGRETDIRLDPRLIKRPRA